MKVLLVNKFHFRKGGGETYYFELARALRAHGHEVVFFSTQDARNEPCEQEGFFARKREYDGKSSPLGRVRDGVAAVYSVEARDKFDALLRRERPDVVHLNLVQRRPTFSLMDAPSLAGVAVVYTAHDYALLCPASLMLDGNGRTCEACLTGGLINCVARKCVRGSYILSALSSLESMNARRRRLYERIDQIVAPSFFMREMLVRGGVPRSKVSVLHNFIGDEVFVSAREEGVHARGNGLIYVGRLSREKGIDVILRAFAQSRALLPPATTLTVVGDGPLRDELERLAEDEGIADVVSFAGFKRGRDLSELLGRSRFLLIGSRCYENYPYAVAEGFAYGTPAIGSNIGGIPELIEDGLTGFLFECESTRDLADTMVRALSLPEGDYRAMQDRCRGMVRSECSQDAYVAKLMSIYESAARLHGR